MQTLLVRNVHEALPEAVRYVEQGLKNGLVVSQDSRNGKVYRANTPVTTIYKKPTERVLFWPERDANPYFHFMEGLWMLAGRNDVAWISQFNRSFEQFSDNGKTFHGAYGHRWRYHFQSVGDDRMENVDQIYTAIELLKRDPLDRRVVIQMWDPVVDLGLAGKDFPCNLCINVSVSTSGALDMMVTCRSNDIVWGAYGANAVHMSMLQEYIAAGVGVPVGLYWQVSYNWHAYEETFQKVETLTDKVQTGFGSSYINPYEGMQPFPMVNTDLKTWDQDLQMFIEEGPVVGFRDQFFRRVVTPIYHSFKAKENKEDPDRLFKAKEIISQCSAADWRIAIGDWLDRRIANASQG